MDEMNRKIENAIQEIKKELSNRDDIASNIGMQWTIDDVLYKPLENRGIERSVIASAVRFLLNDGKYLVLGQSGGGYGTLTPEGWQWVFGKVNVDNNEDKNNKNREQSLNILRDYVKNIVSKLSPREQKILEMRFGLIDGVTHTLEEVGQEFEVTRESIRRIESKALEKIRRFEGIEKLKELSAKDDSLKFDNYVKELFEKSFDKQNGISKQNKNGKFNYTLLDDGNLRMNTGNSKPSIGVEDISSEIASILVNMKGQDGAMFGVFGRWGRGKTYLMNEIKKKNVVKENFHIVDFNAWKYQDVPALWAYLYCEILTSYLQRGLRMTRFFRSFWLNIFRFGVAKFVLSIIISVIFISTAFVCGYDFINYFIKNNEFSLILSALPAIVVLAPLLETFSFEKTFSGIIKQITKKPGFFNALGLQHEIQKELELLLKAWCFFNNKKSILLIVDDIDRCSENKIIKIVDALKVMLDDQSINKKIVVIAAIDERILKRAIEYKYHNLIKKGKDDKTLNDELYSTILMREYMDKLFLCGLRLGKLTKNEVITIADNFCELNTDQDGDHINKNFKKDGVIYQNKDEKYIIDLGNIDNNNKDTLLKNQMSKEERDLVHVYAQEIENVTPRQIGIFVFRYLLARNILRIKNIDYDYKRLLRLIVGYMKDENIKDEDEIILNVVEMVVPY